MDIETDKMIQFKIREFFGDITVIIIAHRIRTIVDVDKVLVL